MQGKIWLLLWVLAAPAWAVRPDLKTLPIYPTAEEQGRAALQPADPTDPPVAPVRSLGEWEEARAAMTLWTNPSLLRELTKRGKVLLLADGQSEKQWWLNWLGQNGIPPANVDFFMVKTDSIWIRDYGPWPVIDGNGRYGLVHNTYNRPRPTDNLVAGKMATAFGIPFFDTGLVHTGGNYYSDGLGNAFSSTLVFSENPRLTKPEVLDRMREFLGIDRYTTSRLNPGITIEHMDTYGKLVAPDTIVFSDFPSGSRYRADSEAMVKALDQLKSPYGTPYRILRMKMSPGPGGVEFRAYLNSFISNGALYFPVYGNDAVDTAAKQVYQQALPDYEIVGVDAMGTSWGDSVHCRNRNLVEWKNLFLFPKVDRIASGAADTSDVGVDAMASPGATLSSVPEAVWTVDGGAEHRLPMDSAGGSRYVAHLSGLAAGAKVALYVAARDTAGITKRAPAHSRIQFTVGGR